LTSTTQNQNGFAGLVAVSSAPSRQLLRSAMITSCFRKDRTPCRGFVLAFLFLFVAGVLHAQMPEPVTYLTFDEGTGTNAADSVGDHPAALLGGAGWTTGIVGPHALNLPGTPGSYADIASPVLNTTQSFTVAAWVKLITRMDIRHLLARTPMSKRHFSCNFAGIVASSLSPFPTIFL
jgi:hypothetical protein